MAAAHQRARIGNVTAIGLDRRGLAGEHRLIDQHRARHEACIRGNEGAERQPDFALPGTNSAAGYRPPSPSRQIMAVGASCFFSAAFAHPLRAPAPDAGLTA